jgi:hypothetical protein
MPLWSFYLGCTLLSAGLSSAVDIRTVSKGTFLIAYHGYDFEIVCRMNCIDSVVFGYYKTLSFLSYLTRNADTFFTHLSAF